MVVACSLAFAGGGCASGSGDDDTDIPLEAQGLPGTSEDLAEELSRDPTASPTAPTAEPAEVAASPEPSESAIEAVRFGSTGTAAGVWEVKVLSTVRNATEIVTAENMFNDQPKPHHQFFIARVVVRNVGTESASPGFDLTLRAMGRRAVEYEDFGDATCGVIPNPITDQPDLDPGEIARGNVCWSVHEDDVSTLWMYAEAGFGEPPTFFTLR